MVYFHGCIYNFIIITDSLREALVPWKTSKSHGILIFSRFNVLYLDISKINIQVRHDINEVFAMVDREKTYYLKHAIFALQARSTMLVKTLRYNVFDVTPTESLYLLLLILQNNRTLLNTRWKCVTFSSASAPALHVASLHQAFLNSIESNLLQKKLITHARTPKAFERRARTREVRFAVKYFRRVVWAEYSARVRLGNYCDEGPKSGLAHNAHTWMKGTYWFFLALTAQRAHMLYTWTKNIVYGFYIYYIIEYGSGRIPKFNCANTTARTSKHTGSNTLAGSWQ